MEKQYRDPQKRSECKNDALSISAATIRIGSARTCVELACQIEENFPLISVPFLLMVADQDVVVDSLGSLDLYKLCKSEDKTIKRYPALHGLLCEPMPLIETIENDMIAWIQKRV
jgi:alpha-beta hydrolase superfamily lysophospholipase